MPSCPTVNGQAENDELSVTEEVEEKEDRPRRPSRKMTDTNLDLLQHSKRSSKKLGGNTDNTFTFVPKSFSSQSPNTISLYFKLATVSTDQFKTLRSDENY